MPMDIHPPLIDLLGGRWRFEAPVTEAPWRPDGLVVAFSLGDGTVVLARACWPGGPEVRARASGGLEVVPPTVPSPPVSRVAAHKGACRVLVAEPGGFLSLGADGTVLRIAADGHIEKNAALAGSRVGLLATGAAGWYATAAGREITLTGAFQTVLTLPREVLAMAFDPTGRQCAMAYQNG